VEVGYRSQVSFVPLHGLSPTLKTLRVTCPSTPLSEVFNLICSFSLLEDLMLRTCAKNNTDGWNAPSTSPRLTGSLRLRSDYGIHPIVRRLCDFPGGLHFSKIAVKYLDGDAKPTMDLVSRCSDTLESLSVLFRILSTSPSTSVVDSPISRYLKTACGCRLVWVWDTFARPLQGHEPQTSGVSVWGSKHPMDCRGPPVCRIKKPPTYHRPPGY